MDFCFLWLLIRKTWWIWLLNGMVAFFSVHAMQQSVLIQLIQLFAQYLLQIFFVVSLYAAPSNKRVFRNLPVSSQSISHTLWAACVLITPFHFLFFTICAMFFYPFFNVQIFFENYYPTVFLSFLYPNLFYITALMAFSKNKSLRFTAGVIGTFLIASIGYVFIEFQWFQSLLYRHNWIALSWVVSIFVSYFFAGSNFGLDCRISVGTPNNHEEGLWGIKWLRFPLWNKIRYDMIRMAAFYSFLFSVAMGVLPLLVLPRLDEKLRNHLLQDLVLGPFILLYILSISYGTTSWFLFSLRNYAILPIPRYRLFLACLLLPLFAFLPFGCLISPLILTPGFEPATINIISRFFLALSILYAAQAFAVGIHFIMGFIWLAICMAAIVFGSMFLFQNGSYESADGFIIGLSMSSVALLYLWNALKNEKCPYSCNIEQFVGKISGMDIQRGSL